MAQRQQDAGKGKGAGKGAKKGGGGDSGRVTTESYVLKFLCPEVLASAVIGKSGAVIAAMRESCKAKFNFTNQGEFYPSTDCRVLTAQASEQDALNEVCRQLIA